MRPFTPCMPTQTGVFRESVSRILCLDVARTRVNELEPRGATPETTTMRYQGASRGHDGVTLPLAT